MPQRKSRRSRAVDQGFVKSLAHELRAEILVILAGRMASPNELANELDEGLSQVSYHVKVLKEYGRIKLVKTEPRRGAVEHYYRATAKALLPAKAWRGAKKSLRKIIGGGLASELFDDLMGAMEAEKLAQPANQISRLLLLLDDKGWENVMDSAQRFIEEVEKEQDEATARGAKSNGSAAAIKAYTVGVLAFEDSRDLADKVQRPKGKRKATSVAK
jgi:DNA-binding transcriptional ArsR family regulator